MHEQSIHHLYTNKKLRLRVSTNNGKRLICSVGYDNTVRELAQCILGIYNELISDPTHRYYKPGYRAKRIYNTRIRSYYLSMGDYVIDVLNDFDEVECDVEQVNMQTMKDLQRKHKPKHNKAIENGLIESSESSERTFNLNSKDTTKRNRRKKADGVGSTAKSIAHSNSAVQSPMHQPVLQPVIPSHNLKYKQDFDSKNISNEPIFKTQKAVESQDHTKARGNRIADSKTNNEISEFEMIPKEAPKLQQSKFSQQKSDRSVNSPGIKPISRPIQQSSQISRQDSNLRLQSDRSNDDSSFKQPKSRFQLQVKTPEVAPMKSPKIAPQPLGKLELDKNASQTLKHARSSQNGHLFKQSTTPATVEADQTCLVVQSEQEQPVQAKPKQWQKPQLSSLSKSSAKKDYLTPQYIRMAVQSEDDD